MKYNVKQKTIGTKLIDTIISFSSPYSIKDMCCAENYGFFFVVDHQIIHIDKDKNINFKWCGKENGEHYGSLTSSRFLFPSSIHYVPETETLFIIENNGERLRKIELSRNFSVPILDNDSKEKMSNIFSKIKDQDRTGVCYFSDHIYWVSKMTHRCFSDLRENMFFVGNGHAGYSVSCSLSESLLSFPSDICSNKHSIYICDTGNQCVRKITGKKIEYYAGKYNNIVLNNPTVIVADRNDRTVYVKDENEIISVNSFDDHIQAHKMYNGENIVSMDVDDKKLYILEEENG